MKVTVEIDCTPEEARSFLGLPDVRPMQEAVMARLQEQMLEAATSLTPEALLKLWLPLAPQVAPEALREAMGGLFRMFGPLAGQTPPKP